MPTQLQIEKVEAALVKLLEATFSEDQVNVDAMSLKDVNSAGDLIVSPPAVRAYFDGEALDPHRDNQKLTYDDAQSWVIYCGAVDLGSIDSERAGVLSMVSKAKNALAGARLKLDDGTKTAPITLLGVVPEQVDEKGAWYSVRISISAIAQFEGKNANV